MKKSTGIILAGIGIVLLVIVFWCVGTNVSTDNQEVELRTQFEGQNKKCEAYFDKMWKILKQKAGVTDQYKESFKDIYTKLIEGRYSQGDGTLMKWITESNPNFDASLYKDLMQSIEVERTGFFNEQTRLIDIAREHKNLFQKWPSKWFINDGLTIVEAKVISSAITKEVFETGKEDNIDLYDKK